jgi:hypothetical protein
MFYDDDEDDDLREDSFDEDNDVYEEDEDEDEDDDTLKELNVDKNGHVVEARRSRKHRSRYDEDEEDIISDEYYD